MYYNIYYEVALLPQRHDRMDFGTGFIPLKRVIITNFLKQFFDPPPSPLKNYGCTTCTPRTSY